MSVVVIDWLGRGGIAQTTEAWVLELAGRGIGALAVTRPDREVGAGPAATLEAPPVGGRLRAHRGLADYAASVIRERRPHTVVVQNYVLPVLERPVFTATHEVGARLVIVVHDHRLHTRKAGTRAGFAKRLRAADVVVAHTNFVADGVRAHTGRDDVRVIPHPVQVGMLRRAGERAGITEVDSLRAGHVGVLRRSYKGSDKFRSLAAHGVNGWSFVAMGAGASKKLPGIETVDGYVDVARFVAMVAEMDAVLLPYRFATQSGVIVLGQVLGAVPIASAVGGLPEQIRDGVDGLLIAPDAPLESWVATLERLNDEPFRKSLVAAGADAVWAGHGAFVDAIVEITT